MKNAITSFVDNNEYPAPLPCPFCGSEVEAVETNWADFSDCNDKTWEIVCPNDDCICSTGVGDCQFETREAAVMAWNKRCKKE